MIVKKEYKHIDLRSFVDLFSSKIKGGIIYSARKGLIGAIRQDVTFTNELRNKCGIYYFV
jgi:hypothetical protein